MQVDNLGFVYATESGCSTDEIIYTLSKCLKDVADGLGIQVAVFHTGRRTSVGDQIADDLSKGKLENMEDLMGDSQDVGLGLSKDRPPESLRTHGQCPQVILNSSGTF